MNTEERLLKIENAILALSELAAKADARAVIADARIDAHTEQIDMLRAGQVEMEKNFRILTELAVSANERMNTHTEWINKLGATQANLDVKVDALADAQIRTEEALAALTKRVDKLADTVERHIENGRH